MITYKIKSIERQRQEIAVIIPLLFVSIILILKLFNRMLNINLFYIIEHYLIAILVLYIALIFVVIALENGALKHGIINAFKIVIMKIKLQGQLIDSDIYFKRRTINDNELLVKLPKIKFIFDNNMLNGKVIIQNSIKYNDKLQKLDISSSLINYFVETQYLSEDRNEIIFLIEDVSNETRYKFNAIEDMQTLLTGIDKNNFLIDKRLNVKTGHYLISGQTGSGKSYFLYNLIIQMLLRKNNYDMYFIDPKRSSIYLTGELITKDSNKVASTSEDIIKLLKNFVDQMQKRKKELKDKLKQGLDKTAADFEYDNKILIIDEYAALQMRLDKKQQAEFNSLIAQVALEGRALSFFLIIAMQQANAQLINTNIREQFTLQIVFGNSGDQTYNVMFGQSETSYIQQMQMQKGQGWYMYAGHTIHPRLLKSPYLNFDIYNAIKTRIPK